jgi:hypothetical protein
MNKLLREPLVHFLVLGALLFAAYAAVSKRTPAAPASEIVLSRGQVDALAAVFQRKWQRPPTAVERRHLLEGLVREEILYREGVALGLDRDDALIRRRVGQKVELLAEEAQLSGRAEDGELQAYLETHRARYEIEPRITFQQVPLATGTTGQAGSRRISSDPTPLPPRMDAAPVSSIAREFGESFALALSDGPRGVWQGPVSSAFGPHRVLVSEVVSARLPELTEVREAVERDWARERRIAAGDAMYQQLRRRYTVTIASPPGSS